MPAKRRPAAKRSAPASSPEYPEWRAQAGAALERLGELKASTVAERHWKRLFVLGLAPDEAALRAAPYGYMPRPAALREKKGRWR